MKKPLIAPAFLFLMLYLVPLGARPLMIPDETRYGEIPREMIATGDWIVPRLNGVRYFEKPVMGYWLNAGAIMLFGENAFAVRFPSALSVGISALILFLLVRRFGGGTLTGLLTALVYITFLEVYAVGTFSVLDSLLSLFITGAVGFFFFAYREENPAKMNVFLVLSGLSAGLAFLTKGFLAFALPLMAIAPFMIWEGRWKRMLRLCWIPLITAFLVSLPWAVMMHLREPDFWKFFIWNEHIRRFMTDGAQHKEAWWYFILLLPGAALPWTVLFPSAISGLKRRHVKNSVIRFAACWFIFPFLFFSASSGKLLTYILPCFPPLAVLTAVGLRSAFENGRTRAFTIGAVLLTLFIAMLALALPVVQVAGFHDIRPFAQTWKWSLVLAGLLTWILLLLLSIRVPGHNRKITLFAVAPLFFLFSGHFLVPKQVVDRKAPGPFLIHHSRGVRPDTTLVTDEALVTAVCWFYKRSDVYVVENPGELSYGLEHEGAKHRLLDMKQFRTLILKNQGTGRVTLFARGKTYKRWRQELPEPLFEERSSNDGFVLAKF
ncbi:MAG: phospholipid carrier-dependent glycosyltransferase [Pseudomonadota bacterium]